MKTKLCDVVLAINMIAVLALSAATTVKAQGVEVGDVVVMTAEVAVIDRIDRILLLVKPNGDVVEVDVNDEARNFDQIEIGDQVKVGYYESVALYIGSSGEKPGDAAALVAARTKQGDKPGGVMIETVDVSATVQAIDKKERTVTLLRPDGKLLTTKVDKSVKAFSTLKKGDSIHVTFTEAVAISVEKP